MRFKYIVIVARILSTVNIWRTKVNTFILMQVNTDRKLEKILTIRQKNVIYLLACKNFNKQGVGETLGFESWMAN